MTSEAESVHRWRPRFSISTLLLLMVIVGLSIGWSIDHNSLSSDIRSQTSEMRRRQSRFNGLTKVLGQLQAVLSRESIDFDYDLDRRRFSLKLPRENDASKKRITNLYWAP
jgi:hypothetical protein